MIKYLPAMQETRIWSLSREDPLEKGMFTHSSIPAWRILWTEEPGGVQSMELRRVGHNWVTNTAPLLWDICFPYAAIWTSVQISLVGLCDTMDCSTPSLPVHHRLPEFTQSHVHRVGDAIQPSHLLSSPSPRTFNLSQHQGLFKWVSSSHQVAKVLEFQL